MKTKKHFGQYIVFGDYNARLYSMFEDGEQLTDEQLCELKSGIQYIAYNTKKELNAYLEGVNDAAGWLESTTITKGQNKEIEKIFKQKKID